MSTRRGSPARSTSWPGPRTEDTPAVGRRSGPPPSCRPRPTASSSGTRGGGWARPASAGADGAHRDRARRAALWRRGRHAGRPGLLAQVERGEFAALVGPSGCGKSSLLKIVAGLQPASAGTATLHGQGRSGPAAAASAWRSRTRRCCPGARRSTMCSCRSRSARAHRRSFRRKRERACRARDRACSRTVGLDDFKDHPPYQLSGGMQQRANLCRALIHEPELLLLDEPFAALDAFTREELWGVLQDLWHRRRLHRHSGDP